ncbi:MAG: efflux RND transporter periplasmic adaptor subunit [Proteobacteria bacterium]|nr:efflux RND transporter periplasmic adaptor subunit [Pseudomonadota bacterium]
MSADKLSQLKIDRAPSAANGGERRRWWRWLLVLAVLLTLLAWLNQRYGGEIAVETSSVTTAYPYQALTLLNASGYVVAQRKAAVATKATGRLEWLGVLEGSVVKEGQVIARLENRDVRAAAAQAAAGVTSVRAELKDAEVALARAEDLARKKFIATSALDTARARFDKARAGLGVAQANLQGAQVAVDQTQIRAPFDGVVLTKNANVGDIVTPFSQAADSKGAVVSMADMLTLEVEADVAEANLAKIKVGQPCEIALDAYPEQRFRGEVSRLVPTVDRSKASVMTKVRFVEREPGGAVILPEMSAKVAFLSQPVPAASRTPRVVVHADAIVERDGRSVVFLSVEGVAHMQPVTVGAKIGDLVEVAGIKPGDKAVLKPPEKLHDGSKLSLVAK